jgi:hypothetical protein
MYVNAKNDLDDMKKFREEPYTQEIKINKGGE